MKKLLLIFIIFTSLNYSTAVGNFAIYASGSVMGEAMANPSLASNPCHVQVLRVYNSYSYKKRKVYSREMSQVLRDSCLSSGDMDKGPIISPLILAGLFNKDDSSTEIFKAFQENNGVLCYMLRNFSIFDILRRIHFPLMTKECFVHFKHPLAGGKSYNGLQFVGELPKEVLQAMTPEQDTVTYRNGQAERSALLGAISRSFESNQILPSILSKFSSLVQFNIKELSLTDFSNILDYMETPFLDFTFEHLSNFLMKNSKNFQEIWAIQNGKKGAFIPYDLFIEVFLKEHVDSKPYLAFLSRKNEAFINERYEKLLEQTVSILKSINMKYLIGYNEVGSPESELLVMLQAVQSALSQTIVEPKQAGTFNNFQPTPFRGHFHKRRIVIVSAEEIGARR